MRNLKRALSLAMASVMVLGLMVVGTGASYKDVASEDNQEAIEVLQAAGVMVGDENGNFNPDQNVTRNEMAVIMANLMDYRVASYSGTSPFTDVPSWAEPYVAACYTNGITSGVSATTYGGDQTVTTSQAALMLMKALGYFQYQSDFGDDWQLATVSQANKIDLLVDVASGVREAMTRNDVAQLVLNTLEAGMVEADDDTIKVNTGDVSVEVGGVNYSYVTSTQSYATTISKVKPAGGTAEVSTEGSIVELGEKLYMGDLKKYDSATDGFGAPANRWVYKNAEVGTYAEAADYTFEGVVKSSAMYEAVGKTVAKTYSWTVLVDGAPVAEDGTVLDLFTRTDVADNDNDDLAGTARGAVTYVYIDDENNANDVTVCIVNTYAAEITKVEDGTITLDDDDKEFDIEGYDEEDVVLYTKSLAWSYDEDTDTYTAGDYTVESVIALAERVEGEATKIKNNDSVTIDDTTYKYNATFADTKLTIAYVDQVVAFYLDNQGNIVRMDEATESNDYAYVYAIGDQGDFYGGKDTYGATLILTDGTVLKVALDSDTCDNDTEKGQLVNQIVSYSEEDDGSYSLTKQTDGIKSFAGTDVVENGSSRIQIGTNSYIYADKNTVFLINDKTDDPDDFSVYVGYNNVPDVTTVGDSKITYALSSKGMAKVVVITGSEVTGGAEDVVFVVGEVSYDAEKGTYSLPKVVKQGGTSYYEFKAVVDGEAETILVKEGSDAAKVLVGDNNPAAGLAKNDIAAYANMTVDSKGFVTRLSKIATSGTSDLIATEYKGANGGTSKASSGLVGFDFISTGKYTDYYAVEDDVIVAKYNDDKITISSVSGIKNDKNDEAVVVTDDGVVVAIMIREIDG